MKKRVLIVDDSITIRTQIQSTLSSEYECLTASNGSEGLSRALKDMPDAMIVDLEMPLMDGVELLTQLKATQSTSGIPVIIVTTVTAVARMNECRALGCAGFVLKPVDSGYLKVKLRNLLIKSG
jgi:CheY-like chemotaxis protein